MQLMPTLYYEDIATGKRQIRRFDGLTTPRQETPSNIYTNGLYCQKLESLILPLIVLVYFITFHAIIFKSWIPWV